MKGSIVEDGDEPEDDEDDGSSIAIRLAMSVGNSIQEKLGRQVHLVVIAMDTQTPDIIQIGSSDANQSTGEMLKLLNMAVDGVSEADRRASMLERFELPPGARMN